MKDDDPIPSDAYRDADWLYHLYHERDMTQPEIADACGVCDATVSRWMDRHNVDVDRNGGRPAWELVRRVRGDD